jgi:hypothetical protein
MIQGSLEQLYVKDTVLSSTAENDRIQGSAAQQYMTGYRIHQYTCKLQETGLSSIAVHDRIQSSATQL